MRLCRSVAAFVLLVAGGARAETVRGRVTLGDGTPAARVAVLVEGAPGAPRAAGLDEIWVSFVPKVQVVAPGSTLALTDRDDESHTAHARLGGATLFNRATVPDGRAQKITLDRVGVVTVTCELHQEMRAYVLVSGAAAAAVTGADGRFTIEGVPPGRARVRVWRYDDADDARSPPGVEPGRAVGEFDPAEEWTIRLPPPRHAAEIAAAAPSSADEPDPVRPSIWRGAPPLSAGWPHGAWALALAAVAMALGVVGAVGNLRLAARRGWGLGVGIGTGCAAAIASVGLIAVGLHGAVGAALGLGVIIGTAVFAAE